jgi:hypothetical protein
MRLKQPAKAYEKIFGDEDEKYLRFLIRTQRRLTNSLRRQPLI